MESRTVKRFAVLFALLALAGLLLTAVVLAEALSQELNWSAIDGGGSVSTGGDYYMSVSIGQPDAGFAISGGEFNLEGGFWPEQVLPANDAPQMSVGGGLSVAEENDLLLSNIVVTDADAGGGVISVTLRVINGTLTISDSIEGGLSAGNIVGNVSANVVLTGTLNRVTITLGADGVTYRGIQDFFGTDVLTVTANDLGNTGSGGAKSALVTQTITVTNVNDAPVAIDDGTATLQDATVTISVLENDTDADGDTLTIYDITQGISGTVVNNGDGTVTYSPTVSFNGADLFTYAISDAQSLSDTATVTVAVTGGDEMALVDPTDGGTLVYTDTQGSPTKIQVPPGAVTETMTLVFTAVETQTTSSGSFSSTICSFELDAYQGELVQESFNFGAPVTITLHYADSDVMGVDENHLVLEYWHTSLSVWEDAACGPYDRHPDENWLAVPICHLTRFALVERRYRIYLPLLMSGG
jgi:hypothetical protein